MARLSSGADEVAGVIRKNSSAVAGTVVLATCNRYEIYAEAVSAERLDEARTDLLLTIARTSGLDVAVVERALSVLTGSDPARHLFTVGAGLDSAVIGEREIAGQVRRALSRARDEGTSTGSLVRLFETATRTAKEVGSHTSLGGRGRSIVSVALDLADDVAPASGWDGRNVVVLGTGSYAGATMALLRERGCTDVGVYSASGRAADFVASRGGHSLEEDRLAAALDAADVVIGCSGSQQRVRPSALGASDRSAPLTVIDLALTKDFEPEVADLDFVTLITLESVRLAAPEDHRQSLSAAADIVDRATEDFAASVTARSMDQAIVALRRHTLGVLDTELERVRAQHGCTAAAEEVEFALRRIVRSLLHVPTVRARQLAADGRADDYFTGLDALYGITVDEPAAAQPGTGQAVSCPAEVSSMPGTESADDAETA